MRTLNLISAVIFALVGFSGIIVSVWWHWSPPSWVLSAVAFVALFGAASEGVIRLDKP